MSVDGSILEINHRLKNKIQVLENQLFQAREQLAQAIIKNKPVTKDAAVQCSYLNIIESNNSYDKPLPPPAFGNYDRVIGIPHTPTPSEVEQLEQELLTIHPLQQSQRTTTEESDQRYQPQQHNQQKPKEFSPAVQNNQKALIIGDSITKYIEPAGLENCHVITKRGATVSSLGQELDQHDLDQYHTIIMHIGTNNIGSHQPIPDIANEIKELTARILEDHANTKLVLSSVLPRHDLPHLNSKVRELNEEIKKVWPGAQGPVITGRPLITYVDNDLYFNGQSRRNLFHRDGLHINKKGTSVLLKSINGHFPIIKQQKRSYAEITRKQSRGGNTYETQFTKHRKTAYHTAHTSHSTRQPPTRRKESQPDRQKHSGKSNYPNKMQPRRDDSYETLTRRGAPYQSRRADPDYRRKSYHPDFYKMQSHRRRKSYHSHSYKTQAHQDHPHKARPGRYDAQQEQHHAPRAHHNQAVDADNDAYHYSRRSTRSHACNYCGEENHRAKNCRHGQPLICRACTMPGHKEKHCKAWYSHSDSSRNL